MLEIEWKEEDAMEKVSRNYIEIIIILSYIFLWHDCLIKNPGVEHRSYCIALDILYLLIDTNSVWRNNKIVRKYLTKYLGNI